MQFLPRASALACVSLLVCTLPGQSVFQTGTTIWDQAKSDNGHTIFPRPDGTIVRINMAGTVVNSWQSPLIGHSLTTPKPLPGGHILALDRAPGMPARAAFELDGAGRVVWAYQLPEQFESIHHDLTRLPNGNTMLLCQVRVTEPSISSIELIDDCLLEIDSAGTIVWSWYTYQHIDEFGFSDRARQLIYEQGGDWAHANSVEVLPQNNLPRERFREGNLIVSQRFTNTVFIIDKHTGRITWRTGPDNALTLGQHNAHMIPQGLPGAGNILIFDNGSGTGYPLEGRARGFSRVVEVDPLTKQIAWKYDASSPGTSELNFTFWSNIVSGAQRLPNGNTMICSGVRGRLFEVTSNGEIVWEYMSPFVGPWVRNPSLKSRLVYRAYRVPSN